MNTFDTQTAASSAARHRSSLQALVPPVLRSFWTRACSPPVHRLIVESRNGIRAYIHPYAHLGRTLLATGRYETETEEMLAAELEPGNVFLDIGANEGFLSALAATLVGPDGLVVAVEPQSRLQALIEINLRLNDAARYRIFHRAISDAPGTAQISLYPETNNGQSSLMKKPQFGWSTLRQDHEEVSFITPREIANECGVTRFDLVKVDVEGFEHKVVDALLPLIQAGSVRKLLLDYHTHILRQFGVDPRSIHEKLLGAGMHVARGDADNLRSYLLYRHHAA